ncbi:hypothetical protein HAQ00_15875, partial [Acidithiobacillus caldus ATCC 51756]|uniref:hypothetical protein n=1 Tax=Acidithiobacillus caldus TaxID=33059 RepID=UPI001C06925C
QNLPIGIDSDEPIVGRWPEFEHLAKIHLRKFSRFLWLVAQIWTRFQQGSALVAEWQLHKPIDTRNIVMIPQDGRRASLLERVQDAVYRLFVPRGNVKRHVRIQRKWLFQSIERGLDIALWRHLPVWTVEIAPTRVCRKGKNGFNGVWQLANEGSAQMPRVGVNIALVGDFPESVNHVVTVSESGGDPFAGICDRHNVLLFGLDCWIPSDGYFRESVMLVPVLGA